MSRITLFSLLAAVPGIYAQTTSICDKFSNYIESQADIGQYAQCTRVTGGLGIFREFRGEAIIAGPTFISSFWAGNPGASHSTPTLGPTYVEVIGLPDLVSTDGFSISGADYLREVNVPKLRTVNGGLQISYTVLDTIDLPALESVGNSIYFTGEFDAVNVPNLKTARSLSVDTTGAVDCLALWAELKDIKWTNGPQEAAVYPTFKCKSSLNAYDSPLGTAHNGASTTVQTASATSTSSQSTGATATESSSVVASTNTASSSTIADGGVSATATSGAASQTSLVVVTTTSAFATGVLPSVGNSTVSLSTSTRRLTPPSALPSGLEANAGNALSSSAWISMDPSFWLAWE